MEGTEHTRDNRDREEIYANAVRAGKRTYFFDVRTTRAGDYYLTITESKRRYNEDGTFYYQKHKIFLYKEDFEKFTDALSDSIQKVIELKKEQGENLSDRIGSKFTDLSFEDLGINGDKTADAGASDTSSSWSDDSASDSSGSDDEGSADDALTDVTEESTTDTESAEAEAESVVETEADKNKEE